MLVKSYLSIGLSRVIGLTEGPLINLTSTQIVIGSNSAFDISNIAELLREQHICFSIKTNMNLNIYPNVSKIQHWIVINSIINFTIQSLCQKD